MLSQFLVLPPEFGLALLTVRPRAERRLDNTGPAGWRRAPQHPRALGVGGRSRCQQEERDEQSLMRDIRVPSGRGILAGTTPSIYHIPNFSPRLPHPSDVLRVERLSKERKRMKKPSRLNWSLPSATLTERPAVSTLIRLVLMIIGSSFQ